MRKEEQLIIQDTIGEGGFGKVYSARGEGCQPSRRSFPGRHGLY
jgi:hypothetical protein